MAEERRKRILLVTRNMPPLVGGMERLNWHMADALAHAAEVRIVGPRGAAGQAPSSVAVREAPLEPLWRFLSAACILAIREARAWRPDLVLAGSGLSAPLALLAARACGARAAVYVHGLDVAVRHPLYRAFWLPSIRRMDQIIANSRATADICRRIGVGPERLGVVHPGVELPADLPDEFVNRFRVEHGLGGRPILLSVGRLSERKGLREFVSQAMPRIVEARPDVMLLVVGDTPSQALHAEAQTPASIRDAAARAGVADNIRFLGVITDYRELGVVYRAADVHVFPVREIPGDPEGFGMVAVEAAAHGLPTVAFATGGVVDAVAEGKSGRLVTPGDYAAMADAITRLNEARGSMRESCIAFARRFAWPTFGAQLAQRLSDLTPIARKDGAEHG